VEKTESAIGGFIQVETEALRQALARAGVQEAADASNLIRDQMTRVRGGVISAAECNRVRKTITKWLNDKKPLRKLQAKSLRPLRNLIGDEEVNKLIGSQDFHTGRAHAQEVECDPVTVITELLADIQEQPQRLFEERFANLRTAVAQAIGRYSKPFFHANLDDLLATTRRFTAGGIRLAGVLEPFIARLPAERHREGFDLAFLCVLARFANDLAEVVDCRALPAAHRRPYWISRDLFHTVFGLLEEVAFATSTPELIRSAAVYELKRHRAIKVQIAGDSEFNLSRFSPELSLHDETRFLLEMRSVVDLARRLRELPRSPQFSAEHWREMEPNMLSVMYRGLCYASNPKLRPKPHQIEALIDRLSSPEGSTKRNSLLLHFYRMQGQTAKARLLCDQMLSGLMEAPAGTLPDYLRPIFSVNSHRLGGDVGSAGYRRAIEELRSDPRKITLYGHHLLSMGPHDPLLMIN
jgi:hypothetical protein